jgi:hypothetical protein
MGESNPKAMQSGSERNYNARLLEYKSGLVWLLTTLKKRFAKFTLRLQILNSAC